MSPEILGARAVQPNDLTMTVAMTRDLLDRIDAAAQAADRSRSAWVRLALEDFLAR